MNEFIQFMFSGFWVFAGVCVLMIIFFCGLSVVVDSVANVVKAMRK